MGVDVSGDLDPTVDVDGSKAARGRLTPPSSSTRVSPESTCKVDDGLNVVRRRPGRRVGSTIRSTSTITKVGIAAIHRPSTEAADQVALVIRSLKRSRASS